jgi:type IV secretion system protein VirB10
MAEPIINSQSSAPTEPELRQTPHEPMGVLRKNMKPLLYLGVAGLVIAAAIFSSTGKKTPAQQAAAQHEPPQPMVQDNTDNNVQDLKNQLAVE